SSWNDAIVLIRANTRVGKGAGTAYRRGPVFRAPCPRVLPSVGFGLRRVGTAHDRSCCADRSCQRLCPPYETLHYVESKENRPLFRLWARGAPSFPLFRLPRKR